MNEIKEKYLPVGTVVLLKNGKKRVMITGFCVTPQGKDEAYDYSGCLYPEGFLSSNQNCLFNHSQIEKVFHMGLIDDEEINFKKQLKSLIDMADQFSKFKTTDDNNTEGSSNGVEMNMDNEVQEETTTLSNDSDITDIEDKNMVFEETSDNVSMNDVEENTSIPFDISDDKEVEIPAETNDNVEIETLDDFIG